MAAAGAGRRMVGAGAEGATHDHDAARRQGWRRRARRGRGRLRRGGGEGGGGGGLGSGGGVGGAGGAAGTVGPADSVESAIARPTIVLRAPRPSKHASVRNGRSTNGSHQR